ncbi:diaminopimelate epimerase [Fervidibacillus halotolerans]|uniref:Diaminopimelate epimerase n=1 Tax=Fervidibacillus halotolerans TaxID=2980027 RepID=A0A9E8M170_9BACI|nr:diaminopimelate epimerase [Fervidibacillus halotolerans]WAA13296.1 diaminopimelate epimerase [Fervidibacillus halotolerans]
MQSIPFRKVHGSKNDFLLIDENNLSQSLNPSMRKKLAQSLCNRTKGIGSDGILFIQKSKHCDGKMEIYNADGTVAAMCGNGLRCAGRYIMEQVGKEKIVVETMKADLSVQKYGDEDSIPFIQVEISPISFDPATLPFHTDQKQVINEKIPGLSDTLLFTAVSVPNPHLLSIVSKKVLLSDELFRIASYVNGKNPYFPDGVNVSFIYPLKEGEIFVRTYERGVGFTNACGTAMSAASIVTILNGLHQYEKPLTVYNPGGYVKTIVHNDSGTLSVDLIGNATYCFDGNVNVNFESDSFDWVKERTYEEERAYSLLENKAKEAFSSL